MNEYVNVDDAEVSRRVGHVALAHNGSAIVWGGFTQTSQRPERFSVYWKPNWIMYYQPSSQVWHPIWTYPENCPPPSSSPGAGIVGDKMYIFCGFSVESWDKRLPDMDTLNIDDVKRVNEEILKRDGIERLLTMMPGDIGLPYVESNTNDVYCLDFKTRRWEKLAPKGHPPLKCDKLTSWTFEGKVYLFGGYGPPPTQDGRSGISWQVDELLDDVGFRARGWNNQLVVYNPETNEWEWPNTYGEAPGPRAAHAADVNVEERYVLVFGGRFGPNRMNDLYHLNLDTLKWTMLQPATDDDLAYDFSCPIGRSWHTLSHVSGNNFIVFGGYSSKELTLGDCWKFHLNPRDFSRSYWKRMRYLESKERRIWHKSVLVNGTVMAVGGFGTKCPVGSSRVNHGAGIVHLQMSPRSLQSLALDATCLHVHRHKLQDQLKSVAFPGELVQDINSRLSKLLYEKGKDMFVRRNYSSNFQRSNQI